MGLAMPDLLQLRNTNRFNSGLYSEYHIFSKGTYVGMMNEDMFSNILNPLWEAYNYVFVYHLGGKSQNRSVLWFSADGCPRRTGDVPKQYLAHAALLG